MKIEKVLPETDIVFEIHDGLDEYSQKLICQWLIPALDSNPAMIEMLHDHKKNPKRNLLPWSGEFIGKHLTSCAEVYLVTRDSRLKSMIDFLVERITESQEENGYIGPWTKKEQLTGYAVNSHWEFDFVERKLEPVPDWDTWDFYHLMIGLILWFLTERDEKALECACKMADLLCREFGAEGRNLSEIGTTETNFAPAHSLCQLYVLTGKKEYLELALKIVEEFSNKNAGNYFHLALEGKEFFEMPVPRWEGLHPIMALSSLYEITGKVEYKTAFERLWWSMVKTDRHNTGGFTSGESACGNPYDERAIETCCTVAWMVLSTEMLKLSHNSLVADELELSFLNGGLGAISPSGRWCTYNTPMDGYRFSSLRDIVFQSRPGSPELNCCSVNAPRILGLLSQWAVACGDGRIYINFYGNYDVAVQLGRTDIRLMMRGDYLGEGRIASIITEDTECKVKLCFRIPNWSENTAVYVNKARIVCRKGCYLEIERIWKKGDTVEIIFDMRPYYWSGEREKQGLASIYRGPILLAYDPAYNTGTEDELLFDAEQMELSLVKRQNGFLPLLVRCRNIYGKEIILCDFRSAGFYGNCYQSWLRVKHVEPAEFSEQNPMRSFRPLK